MATKHLKLYEHGSGKTIIVTETKLREMESAPTFNRVFRKDGTATTEEVAAYNAQVREEGSEATLNTDSPKPTQPAGSPLPAATGTGMGGSSAVNRPAGTQATAGSGNQAQSQGTGTANS